MDEIITRWATDLQKYQKEFKDQATKVAAWDRLLVENGEKIQKLYLQTHEAEKASNEIDRQLQSVESHQSELEAYLDRYEQEVDDLYTKQLGGSDQLGGADQERERTYKVAENLTDRLDEMGKDLGKMITEINDISGSVSKGNKPDDPVSTLSSEAQLRLILDSESNTQYSSARLSASSMDTFSSCSGLTPTRLPFRRRSTRRRRLATVWAPSTVTRTVMRRRASIGLTWVGGKRYFYGRGKRWEISGLP